MVERRFVSAWCVLFGFCGCPKFASKFYSLLIQSQDLTFALSRMFALDDDSNLFEQKYPRIV